MPEKERSKENNFTNVEIYLSLHLCNINKKHFRK